jgi:prophage maintenance system killer protein
VSRSLTAADVRFIHLVAAKRLAGGDAGAVDGDAIDAALSAAAEGTPFARAANLAAGLLACHAFITVPLQTALLVLHCSLSLDGLIILAPQGVVAGMMQGLASSGDADAVARWLEDRAVPSASG